MELLAGAIGKLNPPQIVGCWPSAMKPITSAHPGRDAFATQGSWILDSPVSNAMAHYLNLALYLLGQTAREWAPA